MVAGHRPLSARISHGRKIERQVKPRADPNLEHPAFRRADHPLAIRSQPLVTHREITKPLQYDGFPFRRAKDGDVLELGNVIMTVMHTPGHTPEHISLLVTDRTRAAEPWFVLTGHTLMVGDLGRTELATSAEAGARTLFSSARRLKQLPDHVEVLPGAYSGSVCGRSLSGKPTSTIGFEKRFNKAFRIDDEDTFVAMMIADIPPPPPDAARNRAANACLAAAAA